MGAWEPQLGQGLGKRQTWTRVLVSTLSTLMLCLALTPLFLPMG